jgi:hypothetical protein
MSKIQKLVIPSCACGKIIKATPLLIAVHCARYDISQKTEFECGHCSNTDLWKISEMLWSVEDEHLVTPCCHTEAYAALRPDVVANDYDLDQSREDYETYVWAITGR